jgi:NADP-dependent 3-hydroxy acid dehydrogenase YdfG
MPLKDYRVALVSGASSGIGAAAAESLARSGLEVHALARRRDRLEALQAKIGCDVHVLDIRDRDAVHNLFGNRRIDVLINNAGLGRGYEALSETPLDDIDRTIDTNVKGSLYLLRAVLPGMIERDCGHIVNIGSAAGLYPLKWSLYGSSKAAIRMLSQNLCLELEGTRVRVTEICPGRVTTEFYDVTLDDPIRREALKASGIHELQPQDIADAIRYSLNAPWHVNINRIEIMPTEQTYGGSRFTPVG